jgi:hypothetical protein
MACPAIVARTFVRKRALLYFVGAFAPFFSLRSSIHPESANADSLEQFSLDLFH